MRRFLTLLVCVLSTSASAQNSITSSNSSYEANTQAAHLYATMIKTKKELKIESGERLKYDSEKLLQLASLLLEATSKYYKYRALELRMDGSATLLEERPFEQFLSCANAATKLADLTSYSAITDVELPRLKVLYIQFSADFAECERVRTPKYFHNRSVRF